jgi:hypothetical protein
MHMTSVPTIQQKMDNSAGATPSDKVPETKPEEKKTEEKK